MSCDACQGTEGLLDASAEKHSPTLHTPRHTQVHHRNTTGTPDDGMGPLPGGPLGFGRPRAPKPRTREAILWCAWTQTRAGGGRG